MSSTFINTALPSPTSGSSAGGPGGDVPANNSVTTSSSLYLYTFLATLVLLLGVSSAIVLRSLLLRRRHRRLVAEAIANGTWPPHIPGFGSRNRSKVFGEKPTVYQAALGKVLPEDDEEAADGAAGKEKEKMTERKEDLAWNAFLPVSVSYLTKKPTPSISTSPSSMSLQPAPPSGRIRSYFNRRRPSPHPTTPPSPASSSPSLVPSLENSTAAPSSSSSPEAAKVRVTVLIAMPSQNPTTLVRSSRPSEEEEEELPHMEFGVAELPVVGKSIDDEEGDEEEVSTPTTLGPVSH